MAIPDLKIKPTDDSSFISDEEKTQRRIIVEKAHHDADLAISDREMEKRRNAIERTRHSLALEGLDKTSSFMREIDEQFINGEISLEERGRRIFARHGLEYK